MSERRDQLVESRINSGSADGLDVWLWDVWVGEALIDLLVCLANELAVVLDISVIRAHSA